MQVSPKPLLWGAQGQTFMMVYSEPHSIQTRQFSSRLDCWLEKNRANFPPPLQWSHSEMGFLFLR